LGGILDHRRSQRPLLPKGFIVLHLRVYLFFLLVGLIKVVLQQIVQANIDVAVVILLKKVGDQPVRNLGVKHEVAYNVILTDQG
jgi:hypothetical protein